MTVSQMGRKANGQTRWCVIMLQCQSSVRPAIPIYITHCKYERDMTNRNESCFSAIMGLKVLCAFVRAHTHTDTQIQLVRTRG